MKDEEEKIATGQIGPLFARLRLCIHSCLFIVRIYQIHMHYFFFVICVVPFPSISLVFDQEPLRNALKVLSLSICSVYCFPPSSHRCYLALVVALFIIIYCSNTAIRTNGAIWSCHKYGIAHNKRALIFFLFIFAFDESVLKFSLECVRFRQANSRRSLLTT